MNARNHSLTLAICFLAFATLLTGCHHQGPTAPTPNATPTPIAPDLRGSWTGTERELGISDFCPGRSKDITVQVAQDGNDVSFDLPSGGYCTDAGVVSFRGTLDGTYLNGQLQALVPCALSGAASGTVSASHILLRGGLGGACNRVSTTIDLAR